MSESIFNDSMDEIVGKAYLKKCLSTFNNNVMAAALAFSCGIGKAQEHFNNFGNPLTDENVTFQDLAKRLRNAGYETEANFIEKIRDQIGTKADDIVGQKLGDYCGNIQYSPGYYCFPTTSNYVSCFFHIDGLPHPAKKDQPTVPLGSSYHDNHFGIDISTKGQRTPLYAVCDGVVTVGGGTCNVLFLYDSTNDVTFAYVHCGSITVTTGQKVKKYDVIGTVGSTGATNVHLHFEVVRGKNNRLGNNKNKSLAEIKSLHSNWINPVSFFSQQGLTFNKTENYGG